MSKNARAVMEHLRDRVAHLRGHQRINSWVDDYVARCETGAQALTFVTQLCVADKVLTRFAEGGGFTPTRGERAMFGEYMPAIIDWLTRRGFPVEWHVTLHLAYDPADYEFASGTVMQPFRRHIESLGRAMLESGNLAVWEWEPEMLGARPAPPAGFMENPWSFVDQTKIEERFRRSVELTPEDQRTGKAERYKRWGLFTVGCEIEEGRLLDSGETMFGSDFALVPVSPPEKLDYFTIRAPNFMRRVVDVLPYSPWLE
jgi:hypothetical protein